MKRILSLIITVSLLISMINIAVFAADDVIFTESFEKGLDNWQTFAADTKDQYKLSTDKKTDGNQSIYISDTSDTLPTGVKSTLVAAKPGKEYTVSADFIAITGTVKLYLKFYGSDKKEVKSKSAGAKEGDSTVLVSEISPEGTEYVGVIITTNGSTLGEGYVDNVKLKEGSSSANAEAKEEPKETSKPEEPKVVTNKADGNVLFFDGFEAGLDNWNKFYSSMVGEYKISSDKKYEGNNSLMVQDVSDTGAIAIQASLVEVSPLVEYTAEANFIAVTGTVKLYIKFYNKDKKEIGTKSIAAKTGDSLVKLTEVAPEDAVYGGVVVATNGSTPGEGYIDNVKFIKGEEKPGYVETKLLVEKLKNANPGDIVEIEDGTYIDVKVKLTQAGTKDQPIIIKAKNPGKVIFKGNTMFTVTGSYYQFEDLRFEECTDASIIYFDVASSFGTISQCAFLNSHPTSGNQFWIRLRGKDLTVKDSYFSGKKSVGQFIESAKAESTKTTKDNHLIKNCYFGNISEQTGNGYEAIRLGLSQTCFESANIVVEGCFFEKCDGESETISVKNNDNFIRYNTFYNTKGAVVLRHGDNNSVYGNLFIGGAKSTRTHGVRVTGERQKVYNNYFYNLPQASSSLAVSNGCPYEGLLNEWYYPVVDFEGYNNTFIGGDGVMVIGDYSQSKDASQNRIIAPKGKIYNNAVITYTGNKPVIKNGDEKHEVKFENNFIEGKELGYKGDMTGINLEAKGYSIVDNFVVFEDGIGADINEVKKAPTTPFDVICDWVKRDLYDTGIMKFEPVKGDPFNTDAKVADLLPDKNKINVMINGYKKSFDVEPQLINERTMVPMRAIFEEFGAEVSWDEATATATAKNITTEVRITENSDIAYVNGKEVKLDSPAVIINSRFLVPLRFVSESFGAAVSWVDLTQTAVIMYDAIKAGANAGIIIPVQKFENALTIYGMDVGGFNEEGNEVANAFDGEFGTKWTSKKDEKGVEGNGVFDFGSSKVFEKVYLSFNVGTKRKYTFSILVSDDKVNFTPVLEKAVSSGTTDRFEEFDLKGAKGRYIKIVGFGSDVNEWNNFLEIVFAGK